MKIVLPFPVSVNSMFGGGSGQRRFPSKKYKEWKRSCPKLESLKLDKVKITYIYYFPDKRERDCENYIKATTDYLVSEGVIVNDSWLNILEMIIVPGGIDRDNPRVEIIIS